MDVPIACKREISVMKQPKFIIVEDAQFIKSVSSIRRQWEEAAEGRSLVEMVGSVGLFLYDITEALEMPNDVKALVLGDIRLSEVKAWYSTKIYLTTKGKKLMNKRPD